MQDDTDAFGQMVMAAHNGNRVFEIVEREDGHISASDNAERYFDGFRKWPSHERQSRRLGCGRVLEVGCGAGRWLLELQKRGHEVVGIDSSPLAVQVCRERGANDVRLRSLTRIATDLGRFDTIMMMGNNFGLLGNERRARWLLRRLRSLVRDGGRIVAESTDPAATDDPVHLAYHQSNRRRGRLPGQIRMRVRHSTSKSAWFDYLLVSRDEAEKLVDGTGWAIRDVVQGDTPHYVMSLEQV